jgi:glutamyl-tRNA synthetase
MSETVITRFAPTPTGFLHIGGARTALFNWLYAKAKGGKMLLRIEDTDRARSTEGAILAILDGLRWLGLDWDGEPVYQFARAERHREVAELLLAEGKAYRCYALPEELQSMRDKARAEGRAPGYDGTWRHRDPSDAPEGIMPAIRFKAPQDGETVIEDQVQGRVSFHSRATAGQYSWRSRRGETIRRGVWSVAARRPCGAGTFGGRTYYLAALSQSGVTP